MKPITIRPMGEGITQKEGMEQPVYYWDPSEDPAGMGFYRGNLFPQWRGSLFIGGGEQVYEGQIVGEHCRDNDLPVNVCREKKLTNVRAAGSDKSIILKPPRQMTLELALEYIEEDELVEVTPGAIRLRKALLKEADRRRWARQA